MDHQDELFSEASLVEGSADRAKREVMVDLIKEGFGNRRDNHYYGRKVLESAAKDFEGAKMYIDHLDPEAQRKLAGMPRSVKDLGGRILETQLVVDDDGTAIIRGRAKIAQPWLWELVENDPGLLGVSINAWGKAKPGTVNGRQARIVEGISKVGSVDWVTEAGAGGKVVSLVEAQLQQEEEPDVGSLDTLSELDEEDLTDEMVRDLVQLAEADEDDVDDVDEDYEDDPEAYEDEDVDDDEAYEDDEPEGYYDDDVEYETEEAPVGVAEGHYYDDDEYDDDFEEGELDLSAEFADLDEYIEARAQELAEAKLVEAVAAAVAVVQEQYEDQMVEMAESYNSNLTVRDHREAASRIIESTDFKAPTQAALKAEFFDRVFEGEYDEDGNLVVSPDEVLERAVLDAIDRKRDELSEYTEARVTGAGESGPTTQRTKVAANGSRLTEGASIDNDIDKILGIG